MVREKHNKKSITKKLVRPLEQTFVKRNTMMAKSVCSTSLAIRGGQIKISYHSATLTMTTLKKRLTILRTGKHSEKVEIIYCWWEYKMV